ncbi:MAG: hypothetical protein RL064_1513 [Bacteroidota bacterium]
MGNELAKYTSKLHNKFYHQIGKHERGKLRGLLFFNKDLHMTIIYYINRAIIAKIT